jgi:myo-inositol 2-dehydrogenase/D-chiro-inositol 1-dehydrogenase
VARRATPSSPRLAIAGFGRLAREYYLPALRELGGIAPVAVADPLAASREAAARAIPGVRVFASVDEMLAAEALDAVLVATPPSTHQAVWRCASAASVTVFMEKPFLLTHQLADFALPTTAAPPPMVDFNRRFWPTYRLLAAMVRTGQVGEVEHAELRLEVDVLRWTGVSAHRLDPAEGGALHDLGSHLLDLAWMLFGREPVRAHARAQSRRWEHDYVEAALELADGVTIDCTLGYGAHNRETVTVHGSHGTIRLREPNARLHLTPAGSHASVLRERMQDAAALAYRAAFRGRSLLRASIRGALAELTAALAEGRAPQPGLEDALRNAAWLEAVQRAIDSGRPAEVHPFSPALTPAGCASESR